MGYIDARLKRRAFKHWRAMIRRNGVDQVDPLEPVLLQGSIAVGGGWRKSGRRVFPTSASLIGSELKVTFPGRIREKLNDVRECIQSGLKSMALYRFVHEFELFHALLVARGHAHQPEKAMLFLL